MKKLATLLLAAGLVFSAFHPASAVELKPYGMFELLFEHGGNMTRALQSTADFEHNTNGKQVVHGKHFSVIQRLTVGTRFVMDENLSATYEAILGFNTWGGPATGAAAAQQNGGALGSRSANIVTKFAYLDWVVPGTDLKVRMGMQPWFWPSYATGTISPGDGNGFGTGILVNAPINDNVGVTAGWMRATSGFRRGADAAAFTKHTDDNLDMFVLTLPVKGEGFRLTPWVTFAAVGKDQTLSEAANQEATGWAKSTSWKHFAPLTGAAVAGLKATGHDALATALQDNAVNIGQARGNSTGWWGGLGGELTMFDPFRFAFDAGYSTLDTDYSALDRSGWLLGLSMSYKTAWGVPTLKFWYTSGDDGNVKNGSERPLITGDFNTGASVFFGNQNLAGNLASDCGASSAGTWGLSAQWNKASFIEGLFHNFRVTYVQGTNSKKMAEYVGKNDLGRYLTTKDSVIDVSFDSVYSIYKNLAAMLELSYAFENMDGKLWGEAMKVSDGKARFSDAWRVNMKFMYTF